MAPSAPIPIVVEVGSRRTFATALDWPGWSRSGRDEGAALLTLEAYAPRYATVVRGIRGGRSLARASTFEIAERLLGGAGTDFGTPNTPPTADADPVAERELDRLVAILSACWDAFDAAAAAARGRTLRTGPRGGGRDLAAIREHLRDADRGYLATVGGSAPRDAALDELRRAYVEAVHARTRGELPDVGPRGGRRWTARFAVRHAAWHALDHAWEIEDRAGA